MEKENNMSVQTKSTPIDESLDTITLQKSSLPVVIAQTPPSNPELHKISEDILNAMKYSFAVAAANTQISNPSKIDNLFQSFLATRKSNPRAAYQKTSQALLDAPAIVREANFGRYGKLKVEQYARVGLDNVSTLVGKLQLDPQILKQLPSEEASFGKTLSTTNPESLLAQDSFVSNFTDDGAKYKKVGLFIKKVLCLEETSWEPGDDEIAVGGTATDPHAKTRVIDEFLISEKFHKDFSIDYGSTGKLFAEWDIVTSNPWPHYYGVTMAMAEKDAGGFHSFLQKIWDIVDEKVTAAIAGAVGAAIGGAIGNAVGAAVGYIVGAFIGWLIGLAQDDILGVVSLCLYLGGATAAYYQWAKLTQNPPQLFNFDFVGDGGHYRVWCFFKVYA
jgi:hypothetical protein